MSRKIQGKRLTALLLTILMIFSLFTAAMANPSPKPDNSTPTQIVNTGGTSYFDKNGGAASKDDYAVAISKTIAATDNENEFEITLDVTTTVDITTIESSEEAATVLVMDISTSMTSNNITVDGVKMTRLAAAKKAAIEFLNEYSGKTGANTDSTIKASRYLAIATFSTDAQAVKLGTYYWVDVTTKDGYQAAYNAINGLNSVANTNIQGGLAVARNLLRTDSGNSFTAAFTGKSLNNINTNVILFTDGETNRSINTDSADVATAITGNSKSNTADAANAASMAATVKTGTSFDIGSGKNTVTYNKATATLYTIAFGGTSQSDWLGKSVATSSDKNYAATSYDALVLAFKQIAETIQLDTEAWTVSDPMPANGYIVNNGISINKPSTNATTGETIWAIDSDGEIKWNLLNDSGQLGSRGTTTTYTYTFKYKITLDTIAMANAGADFSNAFDTNDTTTLVYIVYETVTQTGKPPVKTSFGTHTVEFEIPQVKGFAGSFDFSKTTSKGGAFSGAVFTLTGGGYTDTATSNNSGEVSFSNIPSGHTYTLKETSIVGSPAGYNISETETYTVEVKYGQVTVADSAGKTVYKTGNITDMVVVNKYTPDHDLSITKEVFTVDGSPNFDTDSAGCAIVWPGATIVYEVTVTNTGRDTVTGISVSDKLSGISGPYGSSLTTSESFPTYLASGASATRYYSYVVPGNATAATIANTATVESTQVMPAKEASATIAIEKAELSVEKVITTTPNSDGTFDHGSDITFKITVTNSSGFTAYGVSLVDMLDGADITSELISLTGVNPSSFDLESEETIIFTYTTKAEGNSVDTIQTAIDTLTANYNNGRTSLAAAVTDAEEAVTAAEDTVIKAKADVDSEIIKENAPIEETEDDEDFVDPYDQTPEFPEEDPEEEFEPLANSLADANEALVTANEALAAANDALDIARSALNAFDSAYTGDLNELLAGLGNIGNRDHTNTATITYAGDKKTDSVDYEVTPEKLTAVTINKEVSIDGGTTWTKYEAVIASDVVAVDAEYRITVTNVGTETIDSLHLVDSMLGIDKEIVNLAPNEVNVTTGAKSLSNESIESSEFITNTASVTYGDGEDKTTISSDASVYLPPVPAARLSIDKQVKLSSETDAGWMNGRTIYSNNTETFDFRITITNTGNKPAIVDLTDAMTVVDANGDVVVDTSAIVVPADGGSVTVYVRNVAVDSGDSVTNIASYVSGTENDTFNPKGSDEATATVKPVPYSVMSVKKTIMTGVDQYNDPIWVEGNASLFTSAESKTVVFRIAVSNSGTAVGRFTLSDIINNDGNIRDISDALYTDISCTDEYKAVALDGYFTVEANGTTYFYYQAEVKAGKNAVNSVTITPIREEEEYGKEPFDTVKEEEGTAEVTATVTANPTVSLVKQVALGTITDGDDTDPSAWTGGFTTTANTSITVTYKISVTVQGLTSGTSLVVGLDDQLNGETIALGTLTFTENETKAIYVTMVHNAGDNEARYVNTVKFDSVVATTDGEAPEVTVPEEGSSTTVIIPGPTGGDGPYGPGTPGTPDTPETTTPSEITDEDDGNIPTTVAQPEEPTTEEVVEEASTDAVPLAQIVEEAEVVEVEIPTGGIPQTGDTANVWPFIVLAFLSGTGAVVLMVKTFGKAKA